MTVNLPTLPIELILNIVNCMEREGQRRFRLCEALRLTCQELNSKVMRYFGINHYKRLQVPLSEIGLDRLLRISKGPLAHHVKSVTVQCGAAHQFRIARLRPGFDSPFDEKTINWLQSGGCAEILGPALSNLPNLSGFHIVEPGLCKTRVIKQKELELLSVRWAVAVRALLVIADTATQALEALSICANNPLMAAIPSHLGDIIIFTKQLRMLRIDIAFGNGKDAFGIADFIATELDLEEITLMYLNTGYWGLDLNEVHKLRSQIRELDVESHIDSNGWAWIQEGGGSRCRITLRSKEGDDIKYWVKMIKAHVDCGDEWDFEGNGWWIEYTPHTAEY
ncbi:hypothetical protein J4E83_010636 [Alternaria metachromatica]|uniref:uncharacterized protein n=1 Tax=Alternaria metachromatica TaxID=283354 RepID=UPI0020C25425|nr:uncharacterized protein J4E83_010636 [Alternaria metachromatica]KAI4605438.1 hypothetical protein J4E83_010636 [Alternaria metachromatica]